MYELGFVIFVVFNMWFCVGFGFIKEVAEAVGFRVGRVSCVLKSGNSRPFGRAGVKSRECYILDS